MKLKRLFQPANPQFWMMVALNAMSSVLTWLSQTQALALWVRVLFVVFAIGNMVLGARLAVRLMRS
jgi:hypothetical protein